MYAAMWSEHCSYKSSKVHLRTMPTEGPRILVGPGQDAGAVDIGDGLAAVFKMESHSHPSAIEPYQGAATGVGGIVRDIVSMGARPIAILDPLRFGSLSDERNRWLFEGVVAGIGGYGNCIGVPTVGGELQFADPHSANPTVNVMCVGVTSAERLVTAARDVPAGSVLDPVRGRDWARRDRGRVGARVADARGRGGRDPAERPDRRPVRGEAPHRGLARARRTRPARGPAGSRRRRDHVRRERVGRASRARRRARPRRGPAPRARPGGVRDPDQRIAGAHARGRPSRSRRAGSGRVRTLGVARRRGRAVGRGRDAAACDRRGDRGRGAGAFARRRGSRVRTATGGAGRTSGPARPRPDVRERDRVARGRVRHGAVLAQRGRQAVGVGAVRLDRAGRDRPRSGRRRRARPGRGNAARARAVLGRQGPIRPARTVPRRRARGRRVCPQRRLHGRDTARDHELPELRQPRATPR